MLPSQDLQLKVRERYRRLLTADMHSHHKQLCMIVDFFRSNTTISSLLAAAAKSEPDLEARSLITELGRHGGHRWLHETEDGQATLIWTLMQAVRDGELGDQAFWRVHTGTNSINDKVRTATETVLCPLFDYLCERLGEHSTVLHMLERYVRALEWFDRDELLAQYEANPGSGEEVYNRHLRRFLFTEGMDVPFTEAQSPSGRSDALANLHTDDPFACEVKVFDGESRGRRHLATGLHQAYAYAADYGQASAYLIVVNLSGQPLKIACNSPDGPWPPCFELGDVRVHIIVARGRRLASASKSGPARPRVFERDDLVSSDPVDLDPPTAAGTTVS